MRKFFTFLVSVSLVLTAHTGTTLADSTKETYSPTIAVTNVPAQDGYFGESFTWRDGRITQLFFVSRPEGCPGADADYWTQCAIWITDGTGEYLVSRRYLDIGTNQLSLYLKKPLKDILALGPITASIGTYRNSASNVYGPTPPADFALSKTFQITTESLNQVEECNPFSETIANVVDKDKRQALVEDIIFDADGHRNKPIIDRLRVGKRLNGVTQAVSIQEAKIGKATAVSGWGTGEFPESGYYFRAYDKVRYMLYRFDCSKLVTLRYYTYSPFRFGKDGIAMDFSTIGPSATNEWLTIAGKTYQTIKGGRNVAFKSGPIKSCKSLVRGSFDSQCFIPTKPGSFNVTVKQQYVGSGNLIITCRGNIYSVNCSTATDKSVSRTLTGKFSIDSSGVVKGPGWWTFDWD